MNNKGAGVVAVIVAIALVSILVSLVLSTSYTNFKMKQTNYKSKNNFYSAEKALDEISVGLQGYISEALSYSYLEVMGKYGTLGTVDAKKEKLESLYYQQLWERLATDVDHKNYQIDILRSFVTEPWNATEQTGALVTSVNPEMVTYLSKGIVLKDVEVYYRDASGYSSLITTDIRLSCPDLEFGSTSAMPDIMSYALVANKGLVFEKTSETNTVKGQIYAKFITAEGVSKDQKMTLNFINDDVNDETFNLISKGNVNLTYVNATFPEQGILWAKSVILNTSKATLGGVNSEKGTKGSTYLSDDLVLNGKESFVKVKGDFYGYGNSKSIAGDSSSIIVNGFDSEIDLTECENVEIAGHAFVGTSSVSDELVDPDIEDSEFTAKKGDVLTGESIAVKSNQLLYLLPGDAVGVDSHGNSRYHKNPLTKEEYKNNVNEGYIDYYEDYAVFGDKTLGDYASDVIRVFIPSGKTTMVYYYLKFDTDVLANEFFEDYYNTDYKKIEKYFDFYTKVIKVPDSMNLVRFTTAGNILSSKDSSEINASNPQAYELNENNAVKNSDNFISKYDLRTSQKKALCTKLVTRYEDLEDEKKDKALEDSVDLVFKNLVNVTKVENYLSGPTIVNDTDYFEIANESDPLNPIKKVVLSADTSAEGYVYDGSDSQINLIIATGNVTVKSDFTGLILAGGIVYVEPKVTITRDGRLAKEAFSLNKSLSSGDIISPLSFMVDGESVVNIDGTAGDGNSVRLSDMVIFENWNKE